MPITYKVVRSVTGLTQQDLNTLGNDNWDLQVILEEDIGFQYIFIEANDAVTYEVVFATFGLNETEIQTYGDNDFTLVAAVSPDKAIGTYYYFKQIGGGPPN